MSYAAVAERYARAVFELGVETGQLATVTDQIELAARVYAESPNLRSVLDNPTLLESKREGLLADIAARLALGDIPKNAMRLLARRRRLRALPDVARLLRELADEKAGLLRAEVTAARTLPESFYQKLTAALETATKKKVVLERKQDPSLIAGVVTRIGDRTIDGSVRGKLREIERGLSATT